MVDHGKRSELCAAEQHRYKARHQTAGEAGATVADAVARR
jgi:hypothetical protein